MANFRKIISTLTIKHVQKKSRVGPFDSVRINENYLCLIILQDYKFAFLWSSSFPLSQI